MAGMTLSPAGLRLIQSFEGCRLEAYPDPGNTNGKPITIGYGSTRKLDGTPWALGDTITQAQADELLRRDVSTAEQWVERLVAVPVTQAQFDALVSLCFNIGASAFERSTLLRLLNDGDIAGAAAQFDRWRLAGGRVLPGLVRRRAAERTMFEMEPPVADAPAPAQEPAGAPASTPGTVDIVASVWRALRAGAKLANAATWKERQQIVNNLAALLAAGVTLAKVFGHEIPLSEADQLLIAGAVGALLGVFNVGATAISSADVGLLRARRAGAADGTGRGDAGGGA